eukprot:TRINITY_DN20398_c0_g1_i1.p1 TRINITY_DN20398_c0_g1~~TRINITY_DN20398_c0_g1_i1.p1  ORF type:complete len:216 (+),score=49.32 TRINITY_DN20398_c0_g1_i1:74-721(+)
MEIAVKTIFMGLNSQVLSLKSAVDVQTRVPYLRKACFSLRMRNDGREFSARARHDFFAVAAASSPGLEDVEISASSFEHFIVAVSSSEGSEIKMRINVSGVKTQLIFDDVFSKMVAAAQPIPGFRRVKGGKTPNIPKNVLLLILGPSKVNMEAIKKIINAIVAEYIEKEGLKVTKDLRVEQSFEELEKTFEPGKEFSFDAIIQRQETDREEGRLR